MDDGRSAKCPKQTFSATPTVPEYSASTLAAALQQGCDGWTRATGRHLQ
jgi:hypothetical protein